jgi:hypothetical protein
MKIAMMPTAMEPKAVMTNVIAVFALHFYVSGVFYKTPGMPMYF